jgi:DNA-directed RNA polymerase subunit M/transcription elongation factor TFIIS
MPLSPSENEERFFKEHELRLRMQRLESEQQAQAESEKKRLRELHFMHCPKCGQKLAPEKYGNVEVDVCPSCKGMWLDATELEQIIEKSKISNTFRSFLKTVLGRPA